MNSVKRKQPAGVWAALLAAILALVSVIVYQVNISSAGYFQNAAVTNQILYSVLAIVMLVVVVVLAQVKAAGAAGTVVELISGLLQIAVPVLLTLCLVNLIAARAEGLGFIYFSNADVLLEVQTPANLSSATGTIANMVLLGVAALVSMVAAFFRTARKA